jgi:hypothetical protein
MGLMKNIVYRYSDSKWSDDLEIDPNGECTLRKGDILERRGRHWLVDSVIVEAETAIPTFWIYLIDPLVN